MPNKHIAELISKHLAEGIVHPGNPEADQAPMPILLPAFRTAGMPKEHTELVQTTVKILGEAIVHLIETEGESVIVPRDELAQLRTAVDGVDPHARSVAVYCRRCDRPRSNPLAHLVVDDPILIDGRQLIGMLAKREVDCPHKVKNA